MNEFRSNIKQIVKITLWWMLIGIAVSFYEYGVLISPHVVIKDITFLDILLAQLIATFAAGLTGGTITVLYFQKWIRTKPYGEALIRIVSIYTIVCFIVSYVAGCYFFSHTLNKSFLSSDVQREIFRFTFGLEYLRIYFLWLFILLSTIIALLINDKYGPGVFKDFILGKYFTPRREERIFMFVDLRSSTAIAEKLGEAKYFEFLKEVFKDVTPAILTAQGEIYQYVGDEIIISWKTDKGFKDNNCINCFFDIQKLLLQKTTIYKNNYNTIPEFKAGLHYGYVMAGEIGVVKRDITFLGDVLNTTARIQDKCNELGVDILLSQHLLEKLTLTDQSLDPKKMGDILLRGKQDKLALYTL